MNYPRRRIKSSKQESQRIYTRRLPCGEFIALPARSQRVEWKDQRNDYHRLDSYKQYNNASRETRGSKSSESAWIGNEWNPKKSSPPPFSSSSIITISVEGLFPERVFMIDTGAEPNLIKTRNVHPDTQILSEDKLHIVGVTDGFVESLGSIQVSLMEHPLRMDVVPDNFPILQEGILGTDFLKDNASTLIQYDAQAFIKWHNNSMYKTRRCSNFCQNGQSILHQNKKSRNQGGFSPAPALWRRPIHRQCTSQKSRRKSIH